MATEIIDTRLISEFQSLRRREQTLINDLLDLLPKIDNLEEGRVAQVRDALFHADNPFLMVFVGPFSSGKSSLINALLGESKLLGIGPTPTTDRITILRWGEQSQKMTSGGEVDTVFHPSSVLQKISLVDTPGLESVFQRHEETTRRFLHRSDIVILVMLATQAMTQRNVEYLQTLQEYGKKVIIAVNQADLLSDEERETVREYVLEQSRDRLGVKPEVWMVSAKHGLQAWQEGDGEKDDIIWRASGLDQIEAYIDSKLSDAERMRQKLQTPLQIVQNTTKSALEAVISNQSALDEFQSIRANIDRQIDMQKREQDGVLRDITGEISDQFGAVTMRGSEAIRDMFKFSRAFGSFRRGLTAMLPFSGLFRRGEKNTFVHKRFEQHNVFQPLDELPAITDKVAPRLEGKDMEDIDDLVKYARKEISALPTNISDKIIGTVEAPVRYDRSFLQDTRPELEKIEEEGRGIEIDSLQESVRTTLVYLTLYEVFLLIFGIVILGAMGGEPSAPIILILLLGLALLGFVMMPVRGRLLENGYTSRMLKLQNRYIDTLTTATDKQVAYGVKLRHDAVAPLTRLIQAQTEIQSEQLNSLREAENKINDIESDLAKLGRRKIPGLRG